jgi:hypothetical protein
MNIKLGKIKSATFGIGGYQDSMIGLTINITGNADAWSVQDFRGTWRPDLSSKDCRWDNPSKDLAEAWRFVIETLIKSKKNDVSQLAGTPVEVCFDGNMLKSWRILEEVL